jgi:Molybdopterin cofactor-binding domain
MAALGGGRLKIAPHERNVLAEDRSEHLVAANHSRHQIHAIEAAFDDRHRLLAIADEVWHDSGAYIRTHGVEVADLTLSMLSGPYRVPAYRGTAHVVLTARTPVGPTAARVATRGPSPANGSSTWPPTSSGSIRSTSGGGTCCRPTSSRWIEGSRRSAPR